MLHAFIVFRVIEKIDYSAIFIHDCFGVPLNKVKHLQQIIREVYCELTEGNRLFLETINSFKMYLSREVGEDVAELFELMVNSKINLGNLNPKGILDSKYIVWY